MKNFKKFIAILLAVTTVAFAFSACKSDSSVTTSGSDGNQSSSSSKASDMDCFETYDNVTISGLTDKGLKEKNLVIPASFETAEYDVFNGNEDFSNDVLESISFENPDFILPEDFFWQCYNLKSIELPSNMTTVPSDIFNTCTSLEKINIPSNVETIGEKAFYECSALSEVSFNDALLTIEDEAFRHTAIKDLVLPDSLTTIGESAFADIPTLETVSIPESVTSIAHNAFYYSDSDYGERNKPKISVVKNSWADIHFDEYTDGGLYAEKVYQ